MVEKTHLQFRMDIVDCLTERYGEVSGKKGHILHFNSMRLTERPSWKFKLTPEKFRQLFVTHQKSSDKTWHDLYQEVQTFFNGWIEGLDVKTFDKLWDLMIADQMKKRAPVEFKERHLNEWPSINCPVELAERLEEFEDVHRTLKQKTHTLTPVRRPEVRGSNQAENFGKFDNHNTKRIGNFNPEKDI
ncbi:uncharacterized protein TNCV_3496761 [Trichonephila clavipes]|nr:uncharacterized protein TNCV_3496761 [Trichonephila clavipes]